jgi:hypothetical protein
VKALTAANKASFFLCIERTFSLNEIDEGGQSSIMAEATASILSRELDGLYAGEQVLTDNAATGRVMRLPAAKMVAQSE